MVPFSGKSAIAHQTSPKTLLSLFHFTKSLPRLQQLHGQIIVNGHHQRVLFGSNLTRAYAELGFLEVASTTFEQIRDKNTHSWNTIISAYSKQNHDSDVLQLFKQMGNPGKVVDNFNLVFAIKACSRLSDIRGGKMLHSLGVKIGLCGYPFVAHELVALYAKLGHMTDAHNMFDDCPDRNLVTYGVLLKGYLISSEEYKVFKLFSEMRRSSGMELDAFAFESLVRACGNILAGREGKACHGLCVKLNLIVYSISLQTTFVETYLKCGLLDLAVKFFEELPEKDVVLWSTMIAGFAKTNRASEGIRFFRQMLEETSMPNSVTLASVVLACSQMGSLQQGKSVHCYMVRNGVEFDVVNYTSFIDMYAKCGCIVLAKKVFNLAPHKNVFCWSAMINSFGIHGMYSEAIEVFKEMKSENQVPNSVTFVSLLSACSHSGRVKEGWTYFTSMSTEYGISPKEEHYACMVDLLSRTGKIDEALSFIYSMPMDPGPSSWGALLSACRIHKLVELAEEVAKKLLHLETDKFAVYVLLSNIYADVGMWDMVKKMRSEIGKMGQRKHTGFTAVEVEDRLYVFDSKDRLVCRNTEIANVWTSLCQQMMELVYKPNTGFDVNSFAGKGIM